MNENFYLVIDFEATCCDQGSVPREQMEIIEIGAVMVDASTLAPISEFQSFIRPQRHPTLSNFCRQLTSISQAEVDAAPTFAQCMLSFKAWLQAYPNLLFCSWGDYDLKQLRQDCQFHQQSYPILGQHLNVKKRFAERQNLPKAPGLGGAVRMARLEFMGTHHRGIDDARNIVRLLPYIFGTKTLPNEKN